MKDLGETRDGKKIRDPDPERFELNFQTLSFANIFGSGSGPNFVVSDPDPDLATQVSKVQNQGY